PRDASLGWDSGDLTRTRGPARGGPRPRGVGPAHCRSQGGWRRCAPRTGARRWRKGLLPHRGASRRAGGYRFDSVSRGEAAMTDQAPATASAAGTAYRSALEVIAASEPDVADAIAGELASQRRQLKLIASENYASPAVLLAMGNWLSDKYAE